MIYVHRDFTKVPQEKLDALKAMAEELEKLEDPVARKEFIAANQEVWSTLRSDLAAMSFNKCWYTEARDGVSRYQTDHFRPHGRAKQASKDMTDGYSWLAFDIENFRIVGVLANTQNREYSEETVGKGDWFPLLDPSKRATLANRSTAEEIPLLLDPIVQDDPDKITFNDNGEPLPSSDLPEQDQLWVQDAIEWMGIKQDQLNRLRRSVWRECTRKIVKYDRYFKKPLGERTAADHATLKELAEELRAMSSCRSAFSATARQCLESNKLGRLINRDEFAPLNEAYHA